MVKENCSEEKIIKFIHGDLSPEEAEIIKMEIESSPHCKKIYEFHQELERDLFMVSKLFEVKVPEDFSKYVMNKIVEVKEKHFELKELLIVFASFLVIFLLLIFSHGEGKGFFTGVSKGILLSLKSLLLFVIKFLHVVFLSVYNLLYSLVLLGKGFWMFLYENEFLLFIFAGFIFVFVFYQYKILKVKNLEKK